jgi:hypothetical protein
LLCAGESWRTRPRGDTSWRRGSSGGGIRSAPELEGLSGIPSLLLLATIDVALLGRGRRWLALITTVLRFLGILLRWVLTLSIMGGGHLGGCARDCRGRLVRAQPNDSRAMIMRQ